MKREMAQRAIAEARRFIRAAEHAIPKLMEMEKDNYCFGNQYTAAARRSSLDLTRALAAMRKSN